MGNKKTKTTRQAPRAPKDHVASGEGTAGEAAPAKPGRNWLALLVAGAKMFLGLLLILSAAGALAFGVHRYARTTPRFAIERVEVEGTKRLVRDQILEMGGISRGENIFSLDVEQSEKNLLNSPWIKRVRITRRLPGTVRVELTEREPRALAVIGAETFLVSQDAEPFKTLGAGDPHDLPIVTGLAISELARDRRAELERLRDALMLLDDYQQQPMSKGLPAQEVHLTDSGHAVLTVGDRGVALHLGPSPWKKKLLRADRVVKRVQRERGTPGVLFLDNEAHPERVVVRVQ